MSDEKPIQDEPVPASTEKPKGKTADRLSYAEFEVIKKLTLEKWTDEDIAKHLRRNIITIRKARAKLGLKKTSGGSLTADSRDLSVKDKMMANKILSEDDKMQAWVSLLEKSSRYKRLKDILSKDELWFFVEEWAKLHIQFEDISYTEEDAMEQLIMYQIRLQDNAKQRRLTKDQLVILQEQIGNSVKQLDMEDEGQHLLYEAVNSANRFLQDLNKDFRELTLQYKGLLQTLNATREQREENQKVGGDTFLSLIKTLNDTHKREKMGKQAELLRLSTERHTEEMKKPHKFMDGEERPILLDGSDYVGINNVKDIDSGGEQPIEPVSN